MGCHSSRSFKINQIVPKINEPPKKEPEALLLQPKIAPSKPNTNKKVLIHNQNVLLYHSTINNYDIYTPPLGSGATSTVYLCCNIDTQKKYAIKAIDRKKFLKLSHTLEQIEGGTGLQREIAILKKIDHPFLIHLVEIIQNESDNLLYLVFDFIDGASIALTHGNDVYPVEQLSLYTKQLLLGVQYLHYNNIIHRDIKVENCLLDKKNNCLILCDFGLSHVYSSGDDHLYTVTGTRYYQAPEMLVRNHSQYSGKAADMWSIGVVIYRLYFGCLPYKGANTKVTNTMVIKSPLLFPFKPSQNIGDIIKGLLNKDPAKRLTVDGALNHPFVSMRNNHKPEENKLVAKENNATGGNMSAGLNKLSVDNDEVDNAITQLKFHTIGLLKLKLRRKAEATRIKLGSMKPSFNSQIGYRSYLTDDNNLIPQDQHRSIADSAGHFNDPKINVSTRFPKPK